MSNELDQGVLRRFVNGDRVAFEAVFRRFEPDVYRWILRIVRDETVAEDGVVEAFWRCYRSRARFDPSRSFGAWMRRIATHVALDLLQAARRHRSIQLEEADATPIERSGSEEEASRRARADAVLRAFELLPPKLRVVATLALIEGQTHEEIATALGIPIGTVKSRLFRARRKLRQGLDRMGVNT